jgi:hypothetical protein
MQTGEGGGGVKVGTSGDCHANWGGDEGGGLVEISSNCGGWPHCNG